MLLRTLNSIVILMAIASLIGCASGEARQKREAPSYASPYGIEGWRVNCGRTKVIIVDDDEVMDQFYNADGTHKSFNEFCREAEPSLIHRGR